MKPQTSTSHGFFFPFRLKQISVHIFKLIFHEFFAVCFDMVCANYDRRQKELNDFMRIQNHRPKTK